MALQRQVVSIPLVSGVDTKSDSRDLNQDQLITASNINMDVGGSLNIRNGFNPLSTSILGGGTLPASAGSGSGFLNEIDSLGAGGLFTYDTTNAAWVLKGKLPAAFATVRPITKSTNIQVNSDSATIGGMTLYAWEETQPDGTPGGSGSYLGVKYQIIDETNGSVVVPPTSVNTASPLLTRTPRVLALGTSFYIFFEGTGPSIFLNAISSTTPLTNTATTVIAGTTTAAIVFDALVSGAGFILSYYVPGTTTITTSLVSTAGAVSTTRTVVAVPTSGLYLGLINGGTQVALMYTLTSTSIQRVVYTVNLVTTSIAAGFLYGIAGGVVTSIAIGDTGSSTYEAVISIRETAFSPDDGTGKRLELATVNLPGGGIATHPQILRGCDLCSVAFNQAGVNYYVVGQFSNLQPVYFVIDDTGRQISRLLYQSAGYAPGGYLAGGGQCRIFNVTQLATSVWSFPLSSQSVNVAFQGAQVNTPGVSRAILDFTLPSGISRAVLGGNLHIAGSQLSAYDGNSTPEHGFHLFPEGAFVQAQAFQIVNPALPPYGIGATTHYNSVLSFPPAAIVLSSKLSQLQAGSPTLVIQTIPTQGFAVGFGTFIDYFQFGDKDVPAARGGFHPAAPIIEIPVSRGDVVGQVANAVVGALNSQALVRAGGVVANLPWSAVAEVYPIASPFAGQATGNVLFAGLLDPPLVLPTQFNSFGVTVSVPSGGGVEYLNLPDGFHIKPGQYFTIQSERLTAGIPTDYYVWFRVSGIGTDPAPVPALNGGGIQVNINVGDSAAVVANAVAAALLAAGGGLSFVAGTASVGGGSVVKVVMPVSAGQGFKAAGNFNLVGSVGSGSYQYCFVHRWTDLQGQIHRSAPSVPLYLNIGTGQASGNSTVMSVPTLKVTNKVGTFIEVYRTLSNGSVFYNVTPGALAVPNNPAVDFVQYSDTSSDASIQGNETLYTSGGALPNFPAPPCSITVHHRNRIFVLDTENPYRIVPSKQLRPGKGVEFGFKQDVLMEPVGGPPTAMLSMDDKLVIFQAGQVWVLTGDGPDDSGSGAYGAPQLVSSRAGAVNQNGVVLTQMGIMYKSSKGIFLLSRSLQVSYIGSPMEGFNSLTVSSAVVVENKTRVVFTTSGGATSFSMIFDYFYNVWSTWTLPGATGVVNAFTYGGALYFSDSSGKVWTETAGFTDNGSAIAYSIQTKWIGGGATDPLPGESHQQAFQRIRSAYLLGTFGIGDTINVGVQYDYISTFTDALGPYVAAPPGNQVKAFMRRQKGQAMSFIISGTTSQGMRLIDISVELGIKKGLAKLPPAQAIQ